MPRRCWKSYYQRPAPLLPLASAEASVSLVLQTGLGLDAPILDVGCGTSAFPVLRYANLLATDIGPTALAQQR